jgi:hypothetical protein
MVKGNLKKQKKLFDSSEDEEEEIPKLIPVNNKVDSDNDDHSMNGDDDEDELSRSYEEVDSDLEIAHRIANDKK